MAQTMELVRGILIPFFWDLPWLGVRVFDAE